ncbi:MAG: YceI family protein [Micropepsaceae bacterium]
MMQRLIAICLAFLWFASTAQAAVPASWHVDPAKSSLTFTVKVNGQSVNGRFPGFGALIEFDPANLVQSSARITIDATGIRTFDATRDAMLLKPAWFNVLDFPQATFQSTGFTANGPGAFVCNGKLTIKGTSKDVSLPFKLSINGNTAMMKGETTIQRLAFKVGEGPDYTGETPVSLTVKVFVNIKADRVK